MNNNHKRLFFGLIVAFFMVSTIALAANQLGVIPQTTKTSDDSQLSSLAWTDYDCDDFSGAGNKIYKQMTSFSFIFQTETITYALYLGARFFEANSENATLVIYAFLVTLGQYFVSSQSTTFTFSLKMTYRTTSVSASGSVPDNTPFLTTSTCLCAYPLFQMNFTKQDEKSTLTINITYNSHSSSFDESGTYITSASLATQSVPILPYFVVLGLVLAVLINIAVKRRKLV